MAGTANKQNEEHVIWIVSDSIIFRRQTLLGSLFYKQKFHLNALRIYLTCVFHTRTQLKRVNSSLTMKVNSNAKKNSQSIANDLMDKKNELLICTRKQNVINTADLRPDLISPLITWELHKPRNQLKICSIFIQHILEKLCSYYWVAMASASCTVPDHLQFAVGKMGHNTFNNLFCNHTVRTHRDASCVRNVTWSDGLSKW